MAAQNSTKQSASKTPATAEEQNVIRRAKKAKQRHTPRRAADGTGYLAGLKHDRLKQRGVTMLDQLDKLMKSSSPTAQESLRLAMIAYVDSFTAENDFGDWKRHIAAKQRALEPLTGTLRTYAERQLDATFRASRAGR